MISLTVDDTLRIPYRILEVRDHTELTHWPLRLRPWIQIRELADLLVATLCRNDVVLRSRSDCTTPPWISADWRYPSSNLSALRRSGGAQDCLGMQMMSDVIYGAKYNCRRKRHFTLTLIYNTRLSFTEPGCRYWNPYSRGIRIPPFRRPSFSVWFCREIWLPRLGGNKTPGKMIPRKWDDQ